MKTICSIVFLFGKKITAAGYFMIVFGISVVSADFLTEAMALTYPVNDTRQEKCYNDNLNITCPVSGSEFYGQDAQYTGNVPDFTNNGDGTVSDNNTGLIWQKSPDTDGDGDIDAADKLTWIQIQAYSAALNAQNFGGERRVRIHGVGFPVQFIRPPELQVTGVRFATLMRELTYKNGGTFVGLNNFRP